MPGLILSTEQLFGVAEVVTGHPVWWYRGGPKGEWDRDRRRIGLRHGMSESQTRSTLAHEIAHALFDDPAGLCPARELRADRYAAHLLVRADAFARAEHVYGTDEDRIAEELGVTRHVIRVWKKAVTDRADGLIH